MTTHLHLRLDTDSIKLIEYSDQVNRKLGVFLKTLTKVVYGVFIAILLIPFVIVFFVLTAILTRIICEYFALIFSKAIKSVKTADERELMEALIQIEKLSAILLRIKLDPSNGTKTKRIYYTVFFGRSLKKFIRLVERLQIEIEHRVYPTASEIPSTEQIERLLKVYEGMPVED